MVERYYIDGDDFEAWFQQVGCGSYEPGLAYQYVKYLDYEKLERERDEWARKANEWRAKYAELRYPGMKGVIKPAGAAESEEASR